MIDFLNSTKLSEVIDSNDDLRHKMNQVYGKEQKATVKPILCKLMENAKKNALKTSASSFRHEDIVKKFASSLYCITGKAAYEMLQVNLGGALPSVSTLQRTISTVKRIKEGNFRFDELVSHLKIGMLQWLCTYT